MTDNAPNAVLLAGATGAVGLGTARRLAEQGVRLALAVRRPWQVERVRNSFEDLDLPPEQLLIGTIGDRDPEAVAGFVKGAEDALGELDGFVSTLGAFHFGDLGKESATCADDLFEANVLANHRLVRAVLPRFRRRRRGQFVFCGAAAVQDESPQSGMALYLASKAALDRYASTLGAEVSEAGIGVTLLCLSVIDTEANRESIPDADTSSWTPISAVAESIGASLRSNLGSDAGASNFARKVV
ncbi:MAG: SDR family NAD(P)-dependent oxidoreductase [Planctomycetota bacterium]